MLRRVATAPSAAPTTTTPAVVRPRQCIRQHRRKHVRQVTAQAATSIQHPAAVAAEQGTLGFGFSAGGLLFPYLLGVISELRDLGLITDTTKLAGASAGSLVAACHRSGLTDEQLIDACLDLAEDCRKYGTRFRLRSVLESYLTDLLPDDVHNRCHDSVFVAVTRVAPRFYPELVGQFHDREDLVSALLTSCHIPWYLNGNLFTTFRGSLCFDGGITNFIPSPPSTYTVKVCCFPTKQIPSRFPAIDITPDRFEPSWPHDVSRMLSWALEPADKDMLLYLEGKGRKDAKSWASSVGLSKPNEQQTAQKAELVLPGMPGWKS